MITVINYSRWPRLRAVWSIFKWIVIPVVVLGCGEKGPDLTNPECFQISYASGFTLAVGPEIGPIGCTVTGNASGCSFNPTITDATFLPVPPGSFYFGPEPNLLPTLGPWGSGCWQQRG